MNISPAWLRWPETKKIIAAFAPETLRFVGGAVRDALLRIDAQDVDAATTIAPKAVIKLLQKAGIKVLPTGIKHGTVTAIIGEKHFEITTLRRDTSCDGRWAKVVFTDDWREDAARRDFTMNAMTLSPAGELFDYFGGETDAKAGCVRFIGPAEQRIAEDYLRILRFFRFHAHYGQGSPDEEAMAACAATAKKIAMLSGERIRHEMLKLLAAPRPSQTLELMQQKKILVQALGYEIRDCEMFSRFERIEDALRIHIEPDVKLVAFLLSIGAEMSSDEVLEKLAGRLRFSNDLHRQLHILITYQKDFSPKLMEAEQKHLIRKLGAENFAWALIVNWALGREMIGAKHPYSGMLALAAQWELPEFPITGDDLIALGIKPGKQLGEMLKALEEKWEKSDYKLGKKELLQLSSPP